MVSKGRGAVREAALCDASSRGGQPQHPQLPRLLLFPLPQRGNAVLQAVWDDMVARGLGAVAGTMALFGGSSAGGRGALFNCDAMGSRLRAALTRVRR